MNKSLQMVVVAVAFVLIAGGAYYLGSSQKAPAPVSVPSPAVSTPTPDETETLKVTIGQALAAEGHEGLAITVSKIAGNYASGLASAQGGGGGWLAAKVDGQWKLVWSGNGTITCKTLVPYPDFPRDMIPECYDDVAGKGVTR